MQVRPPGKLTPPAKLQNKIVKPPARRAKAIPPKPIARRLSPKPSGESRQAERPKPRHLLLAILLGASGEALHRQCEAIARTARRRGAEPVFLIDDDSCFAHFRGQRWLFEFIPPPSMRSLASPLLQWDTYLRRRAKLLHEKWQPSAVVAIGPAARALARHMPPTSRGQVPTPTGSRLKRIWRRSQ